MGRLLLALLAAVLCTPLIHAAPGAPIPSTSILAQRWGSTNSGFKVPVHQATAAPATKQLFSNAAVFDYPPVFGDPTLVRNTALISSAAPPPESWKFTKPITLEQIKRVTGITPTDAWIAAHINPESAKKEAALQAAASPAVTHSTSPSTQAATPAVASAKTPA